MDTKYQVFISSTYEDMQDERLSITNAILKKEHIPVGMELFTGFHEKKRKIIEDMIDASDIFLIVLGGRYGSIVAEMDGVSYVEFEYDYAMSKDKPVVAICISKDFLADKKARAYASKSDLYSEDISLYNRFQEKVTKERMASFYSNVDNLEELVRDGIDDVIKKCKKDLVGWVRSDARINDEQSTFFVNLGIKSINCSKNYEDQIKIQIGEAKDIKMIFTSGRTAICHTYQAELCKAMNNGCDISVLLASQNTDYVNDLHNIQRNTNHATKGFGDLNKEIDEVISWFKQNGAKDKEIIKHYKTQFRANLIIIDGKYGYYTPTLPPVSTYKAPSFELIEGGELLNNCIIHFKSIVDEIDRERGEKGSVC